MARQTNFAAGELAPRLWGRTDLPLYLSGARRLRNFFVSLEGSVVSRPGTQWIAYAKSGAAGRRSRAISPPRLIPFVYSDTESFLIEAGDGYFRFFSSGAVVGGPTEVPTPYYALDLRQATFAQVGASLFIAHPNYPPAELRYDGTTWTFQDIFFTRPPASSGPYWQHITTRAATMAPHLVNLGALLTEDATHPAKEWGYWVSARVQDVATGREYETLAKRVTRYWNGAAADYSSAADLPAGSKLAVYVDRAVTLRRGQPSAGLPAPPSGYNSYVVLEYLYYRGQGDLLGFLGASKELDFVDTGAEPNYALQPLRGTNPCTVRQFPSGEVTDYPGAVAMFEGRRCLAAFRRRPSTVMASATDFWEDHDTHIVPLSGQALELQLASDQREQVRSLLGHNRLLVFSDAGVRAVGGVNAPLDVESFQARQVDGHGAGYLPPLALGDRVVYARAKRGGARELSPTQDGLYRGRDITEHASHLFTGVVNGLVMNPANEVGRKLVAWAYQEDPWGVVWAVREDGKLLSGTPGIDGLWAWAEHDTNGDVLDVCVVPEGAEDAVYLVVDRTSGIGIERMWGRVANGNEDDGGAVDAGIKYENVVTSTFGQLDHMEGKQVYFVAAGVGNSVQGPYTVQNGQITVARPPVANRTLLTGNVLVAYIGQAFTAQLGLLDIAAVDAERRMAQKTTVSLGFEVEGSRGLWVGQDSSKLNEWRQRTVAEGYNSPSAATAVVEVPVAGAWDSGARAWLEQRLPLWVTVLGVSRKVAVGG